MLASEQQASPFSKMIADAKADQAHAAASVNIDKLLQAKSLKEFNKELAALKKTHPDYQFEAQGLAIGSPLTPVMQKILDLNLAEDAKKSGKKVPAAELPPTGVVMYADAGAKPNPGYAGWGIHGYVYNDGPAKKGSGNSNVYLTDQGYLNKSETKTKPDEVVPLNYVDGFGAIPTCSNNAGEVQAAMHALRHAAMYPVKKVLLFTDSMYVVKGSEYINTWAKNNWIKSDGQPVANMAHWQGLGESLTKLKDAGVTVNLQWVKGHSNNAGNIIVDRYATMGVKASTAGSAHAQIDTTKPEGYWGNEDHHPFIHHNCTYFTSNKAYNTPGEYYFGDHGKDDELIGKRQADTSYAYVLLSEPDEMIEVVRRRLLADAPTEDALAFCSLLNMFDATFSRDLLRFGEFALHRPKRHLLDLVTAESTPSKATPILTEINPPRISVRAIEAVNNLKGMLIDWQNNPKTELVSTDITDKIYEVSDKGEYKLRAEFGPGFTTLKVDASYAVDPTGARSTTEVPLVLGVDTPERNSLKKLEKHKPVVTVITWREQNAVRYATIVKQDDAIGIWSGYYANMKYLKS